MERPAENGDMVTVTGQGKTDDEEADVIWNVTDTDLVMDPEKLNQYEPFSPEVSSSL